MSRTDAESALALYRHFCAQCERVVEFLGVAKKLQNILSVQVPNMKHAPLSLAGALKDYLDEPNFEQNRIEYRVAKESADKAGSAPVVGKKPAGAHAPVVCKNDCR
jgi:tRNA threonylcarbamoyladenosine modification (KEOPS) complex Cgi121 subunit